MQDWHTATHSVPNALDRWVTQSRSVWDSLGRNLPREEFVAQDDSGTITLPCGNTWLLDVPEKIPMVDAVRDLVDRSTHWRQHQVQGALRTPSPQELSAEWHASGHHFESQLPHPALRSAYNSLPPLVDAPFSHPMERVAQESMTRTSLRGATQAAIATTKDVPEKGGFSWQMTSRGALSLALAAAALWLVTTLAGAYFAHLEFLDRVFASLAPLSVTGLLTFLRYREHRKWRWANPRDQEITSFLTRTFAMCCLICALLMACIAPDRIAFGLKNDATWLITDDLSDSAIALLQSELSGALASSIESMVATDQIARAPTPKSAK
jgi:hypothetical protein